jgi:hypothetical protein
VKPVLDTFAKLFERLAPDTASLLSTSEPFEINPAVCGHLDLAIIPRATDTPMTSGALSFARKIPNPHLLIY